MREMNDKLTGTIETLKRDVERLRVIETPMKFVPLTTPLTSTSWDGDAYSTTAKTKIDLSSVFSAPAGIKAVCVYMYCRDSGSAASNLIYFGVNPNNTDNQNAVTVAPRGLANDYFAFQSGICPCNADGDIYYQIRASGSGTLDAWLEITGYWV